MRSFFAFAAASSLLLLEGASGLRCFVCSKVANPTSCPILDLNTPQVWSKNSNKYYDATPLANGEDLRCVVGYSTAAPLDNQVFYQSHVELSKCTDQGFVDQISRGGIGSQLRCCDVDGCNWNVTTVLANRHFNDAGLVEGGGGTGNGEGTGSGDGTGTDGDGANVKTGSTAPGEDTLLTWLIVAGIILLLIFIVCCFCCLWRSNKNKKERGDSADALHGDRYGRRNINSVSSRLDFSGRFKTGVDDKSVRGSQRIQVAEADNKRKNLEHVKVFSERNHERYSAVERKLYGGAHGGSRHNGVGSEFNSDASTPRSGSAYSDPYNAYHKDRLGLDQNGARSHFDNDEFRRANLKTTDRGGKKGKEDWHNIWHNETGKDAASRPTVVQGEVNPFKFADK